ncbi:MAG: prefoldin subunit beta [Candidatus Bathyarchaeota archaeon]|nr:MAG: prefoldin subunit beta [Candidatus Bathyarchaeota archaeon]
MSDVSQLPPQVQERLLRLQQLQRNLQAISAQKQQVELELTETDQALTELAGLTEKAVIYKSIGSLLVRSEKGKVEAELKERKGVLDTRTQVLGKQEARLRQQFNQLQAKLKRDLSTGPTSGVRP